MNDESNKLIIKGITKEGKKFRPSDWAQRLTSAVATYGPGKRLHFHPKVNMATIGGVNCVVVDTDLEDDEPMLFNFLIRFGRDNNLQIEDQVLVE